MEIPRSPVDACAQNLKGDVCVRHFGLLIRAIASAGTKWGKAEGARQSHSMGCDWGNLHQPGLTVAALPSSSASETISCGNQLWVLKQNLTNINISGTSISTPTTVASAAPEDNP